MGDGHWTDGRDEVRRFWIEFEPRVAPFRSKLGCGVTAIDLDDALALISESLGAAPPQPLKVIADVDVSALDPAHVLPNMRPPNERGIWFPVL